jgi:hypothetical protein
MSRELAIRVPSEIGAWVRQQPGSATDTTLALAKVVWQRRQTIGVHDPGPGNDRLKVRLEPGALRFIRAATHSRDTTAAVRKLLFWGAEGRALPAAFSRPLSSGRVIAPAPVRSVPSALPSGESWAGVRIPAGVVPAYPVAALRPSAGWLPASQQVSESEPPAFEVPAPVSRIVEAVPVPVIAIVLPVAFLVGGYFVLKWLSGLASAGKVVAGVATAAKVAPVVAAWTPQAAAGLGALFL